MLEDSSLSAKNDFIAEAQQTASFQNDAQGTEEDSIEPQDISSEIQEMPDARPADASSENPCCAADPEQLQQSIPADSAAGLGAASGALDSQPPTPHKTPETESAAPSGVTRNAVSSLARRKRLWLWACGVLCAALLIGLAIVPAFKLKNTGKPYVDEDGNRYTIESMSRPAENIPGKAYLRINPTVEISHGDQMDYYLHAFKMYEMNGIELKIDRLETVYFSKKNENAVISCSSKDIAAHGMDPDIPPYGDFTWTGGIPVQKSVYGVGELVHATDANGAKLVFTSYISFPDP